MFDQNQGEGGGDTQHCPCLNVFIKVYKSPDQNRPDNELLDQ